ncbi:MAG: redoxin domain-containing protein [Pirellulales bacterium]|nr:redoxin domain-containing protein [Pirellulales bacterium]
MRRRKSTLLAIATFVTLSLTVVATRAEEPRNPSTAETRCVGQKIENFSLHSALGQKVSLDEFGDKQAIVVAFLGVECPLVKLYAGRLNELAKRYDERGVAFLGIDSNVQDTLTEAASFARHEQLVFPLLLDPDGAVAESFGASRTPEIFVLDREGVVRYHGRVDDQFQVGVQRPAATREDLAEALDELLAGSAVSVAETAFQGCRIGRTNSVATENPSFTYAEHIAGLLHKRCTECHRNGEIAPFPLLTYDDAQPWAEMIAEVVRERRMPPWFASPEYGKFDNECQLPEDEREMLLTWVDEGCPPGDLSQAPAPPQFVEGWGIGEPDAVFPMSDKPFPVPATGAVPYEHYVIDPHFTEDKWIWASEARPGHRGVVHHILVFAVPPGGSTANEFLKGRLIAAYAPGVPPQGLEPGRAAFVKAGTKFVMQLHYTPNGRPAEDLSQLAFRFIDAKDVTQQVESGMAINFLISIPPHKSDATFNANFRFPEDRLMLALTPHMHLRGKAFRYEAEYPDGTRETLLDVPKYDFNWQITYHLAEPKLMPKGTRLRCTAVFDNSSENPNNPDPSKTVNFGEQTWDEMLIGWFQTGSVTKP